MPPTETAAAATECALQFAEVGGAVGRHLQQCFAPVFRPRGYVSVTVKSVAGEDKPAKPVTMTAYFRELGPLVRDFGVRDDDVWVASFPKTG